MKDAPSPYDSSFDTPGTPGQKMIGHDPLDLSYVAPEEMQAGVHDALVAAQRGQDRREGKLPPLAPEEDPGYMPKPYEI